MMQLQVLPYVLLFGLIGLIAVKFFSAFKKAHLSPLSKVPGPYYARWTNLVLKYSVFAGTRHLYIHNQHLKYGKVVRISPKEVSISDLQAFLEIHRIGAGYPKPAWYQEFQGNEPGLFSMRGYQEHSERRRLLAQSFSKSSIHSVQNSVRAKVEMAVAKLRRDAEEGWGDVLKWSMYLTTDVVVELSFGKSFDMLVREERDKYIIDLQKVMMVQGLRAEMRGIMDFIGSFVPKVRELITMMDRMQEYGERAIQNHKQLVAAGENTNILFKRFMDPKKQQQELDDGQMAREAGNFIVAGTDTTTMGITFIIWQVLHPKNKYIKERLLKEIEDVPEDAPQSQLERLDYMQAIIKETLRVYTVVPSTLPRDVPPEGATLGGYYMPPGTIVGTQAYTLHRDPDVYPDPHIFKPERWLNATKAMHDAFFTFGAGARICLGIHLAAMELSMATFLFFKRNPDAKLAPATTDESMEVESYFCIAPKAHQCGIVIEQAAEKA